METAINTAGPTAMGRKKYVSSCMTPTSYSENFIHSTAAQFLLISAVHKMHRLDHHMHVEYQHFRYMHVKNIKVLNTFINGIIGS